MRLRCEVLALAYSGTEASTGICREAIRVAHDVAFLLINISAMVVKSLPPQVENKT